MSFFNSKKLKYYLFILFFLIIILSIMVLLNNYLKSEKFEDTKTQLPITTTLPNSIPVTTTTKIKHNIIHLPTKTPSKTIQTINITQYMQQQQKPNIRTTPTITQIPPPPRIKHSRPQTKK